MFRTKCGWCQEEFRPGDAFTECDEKLFHLICLNLYRLYCRQIKYGTN